MTEDAAVVNLLGAGTGPTPGIFLGKFDPNTGTIKNDRHDTPYAFLGALGAVRSGTDRLGNPIFGVDKGDVDAGFMYNPGRNNWAFFYKVEDQAPVVFPPGFADPTFRLQPNQEDAGMWFSGLNQVNPNGPGLFEAGIIAKDTKGNRVEQLMIGVLPRTWNFTGGGFQPAMTVKRITSIGQDQGVKTDFNIGSFYGPVNWKLTFQYPLNPWNDKNTRLPLCTMDAQHVTVNFTNLNNESVTINLGYSASTTPPPSGGGTGGGIIF